MCLYGNYLLRRKRSLRQICHTDLKQDEIKKKRNICRIFLIVSSFVKGIMFRKLESLLSLGKSKKRALFGLLDLTALYTWGADKSLTFLFVAQP
jgi:hypothetical protein